MVSRNKQPMMTRRRSDQMKKGRPKRNVSPKNLDDSVSGLSWREERELKKALYASLQESRRQSRDDDEDGETNGDTPGSDRRSCQSSSTATPSYQDESSCSQDFTKTFSSKKDKDEKEVKKKKIHAQRKFAMGCSTPSTPSETPAKPKLKVSPVKLFPVRPKTEDFLTYLCFRGTSLLPPHLDLMNVHKDDYDLDSSVTNGNSRSGFTRDSSPASSSSMSHNNEDSCDVPDIAMRSQTPIKKAARASASTPETARGFVNLRNGRKVSPSKLSPLTASHRKRLEMKKKSPMKNDRLTLKRKAMATLTAAKRSSPQKKGQGDRKLKTSASDGELVKKKDHDMRRSLSPSKGGYSRDRSPNKSDQSRKRKSISDLQDKQCSPSKSKRLNQKTNKPTEARSKSKLLRKDHSAKHSDSLETHPRKRHSTVVKVKRTFKPHRPMTRASTHFKSVLKAAKMVASKKLRLVKKLGDSVSQARNKHREKPSTSKYVEFKKRPEGGEKKKLSLESATSNTSIGSDSSGEIRIKTEQFPGPGDPPAVVQCPTYYPSEEQFRDPILYIQSIQDEAEPYGMCKIVPPCSWKMESRELEDFRFPTHTQYIHKLQHKWSAITEQLEYIKKLNVTHVNDDFHVPQIGGVELDLVKLYELVQKYGGMKGTVGKEKKWVKIADAMKVPKQADRVSKLYAAYCKYLLAYETHTDEETDKLVDTVRREKARQEHDNVIPTCYKCVYKGKSQPLSSFNRAARNTQVLYGQEDSNNFEDTEADYWNIVKTSDDHVSIQGASLDTSIYGSMFPVRRDNPYARHGWNLHNFVESKGSILHHLGLIAGVTVPTLHIGMLYTTKCLSCNGHNLPTVQYLHQGPGLVWYAVPQQETEHLKSAIKHSIPSHVRDKGFCVQQDSVMVPPATLVKHGVSMSRCVQTSKEFVVVFPSVNYCNISMGYNLSETVHYGTQEWISYGCQAAKDLSVNYDVELFSMDALLVFMARDNYTPETNLSILLPYLEKVVEREIIERKKLVEIGLRDSERLQDKLEKPTQKTEVLEEIIICDVSNKICYLSMVLNSHENSAFSLEQGLVHLQKKKNLKHCKLMYRYSEDELKALLKDVKYRIKNSNSSSPAGGSPKRKMLRKTDTKTSPVK